MLFRSKFPRRILPFFIFSWPDSRRFPNNQPRPRPDHFPARTVSSDPIFCLVGGGFENLELDLVGSVVGWAQTQPGPTRGDPYTHTKKRKKEKKKGKQTN